MLHLIRSAAVVIVMLCVPTTGLAQYVGEVGTVQSNDGSLNIRSGASTEFQITGVLQNGDVVVVREISGNWVRVAEDRWVYARLLSLPSATVMNQLILDNLGANVAKITDSFARFDGHEIGFYETGITDMSALSGLPDLKKLSVAEFIPEDLLPVGAGYLDLWTLAELDGLETLVLDEMREGRIDDISPLVSLTNLKRLHIIFGALTDIAPLSQLAGLEHLKLHRTRTTDIAPLAALTGLKSVHLGQNPISDVSPLANLTTLETLELSEMSNLHDLSPLANLTSLRKLDVVGSYNVDLSVLSHLADLDLIVPPEG